MVDFDVDNPTFEPDDWEEDIGNDDVLSTALHDPEVDGMLSEGATTQTSLSLQQELLQTATTGFSERASLQPLAETPEGLSWLMGGCGWRLP